MSFLQAIDPRVGNILFWKKSFPSSADSKRSCQLLAKKWALNTGKLPLGGFPRNSVVRLTDYPYMTSTVLFVDVKHLIKQTKHLNKTCLLGFRSGPIQAVLITATEDG